MSLTDPPSAGLAPGLVAPWRPTWHLGAWRSLASRALLVVVGLTLPLLLLELCLRLLGPFLPGDYQTAAFVIPSGEFGRLNRPGAAGWRRTNEYTTWVQVNSKGLRGPEVPYAKAPGTRRVMVLGDSFVFAQQVQLEDTLGPRLERLLRVDPATAHTEVMSVGVDGWSTANELAWLTQEGYRYEPDVVVLMFFVGNDPGDNFDLLGAPERARRRDAAVESGGWGVAAREALRASRAYTLVEQLVVGRQAAWEQRAGDARRDAPGYDRRQDAERKEAGWRISERLLAQVERFCAERGARLLVVGIPTAGRVLERHQAAGSATLGEVARRLRLEYVDLLPVFEGLPKGTRERLYFPQNAHWTRTGHQVVAERLVRELKERGLLGGPARS